MFWVISVLILIGQETISTSILFVIAFNKNFSFVILSIIFLLITILQIVIFHYLGLKLKIKRSRNIISDLSKIYILKANQFIGQRGEKVFLVFLASSVFPPFLTSFIAAWLKLPFRSKFYCILLGDYIWYGTILVIMLGTDLLTENPSKLLMRVVVVSLLFVIFQRRFANQLLSNNRNLNNS